MRREKGFYDFSWPYAESYISFLPLYLHTHKLTLRSQNPFLSFPSNGGQRLSGRLFIRSPIMMAKSNSKSEYQGDKKLCKALKMVAGASLALACALSIFGIR